MLASDYTTEQIVANYNSYMEANKRPWDPLEVVRGQIRGQWNAGNDFSNISSYVGSYAKSEWERLQAMFPEEERGEYMHLFSGGIKAGNYYRLDEKGFTDQHTENDFRLRFPPKLQEDNQQNLFPVIPGGYWDVFSEARLDLIFADPPWNDFHSENTYKVKPLNRLSARNECHRILVKGGILVWKDAYSLPRDNKLFEYIGFIPVDPPSGKMDRSFRLYKKR